MDIPFTYLIGWSKSNQYYYGVRYAIGCHPSQLWESYFTSSDEVAKCVKENGNPDIIQVRKTFTDPETAREWEHRVLRRMRVIKRNDFLNKSAGKNNGFYQRTEKHLKALSEKAKKETNLIAHQFKVGNVPVIHSDTAKKQSDSRKKYLAENPMLGEKNPFYGKIHNENTRDIIGTKNGKPITVDGVRYRSIKQASEKLGRTRYWVKKYGI